MVRAREMKWITRNHVHVDRVACPWLIHRFIDQEAEFEFIAWPGPVPDSTDGTLFDFPDMEIPFTHHDGKCTFEVLIDHYELRDPVLFDMAKVIHGADVVRDIDLVHESRGVELTLSGVSFLSDDDHQAIQRGFIICDSLYAGLLLRMLRRRMESELEGKSREESFRLLHVELRQRLPPTIKVGPMT
ncbi:MAG: chromate resistance protein ChrB domain-containing protein [Promethearchaeota archaeon]